MYACYDTQTEVEQQMSKLMMTVLLPQIQQLTQLVTRLSDTVIKCNTELRDQVQCTTILCKKKTCHDIFSSIY